MTYWSFRTKTLNVVGLGIGFDMASRVRELGGGHF
jgi:hypothetical protein